MTGASTPGGRLHVIGGGMAGLACAVAAVRRGLAVTLHEGAPHAGGRCRSYHDPRLDRLIDNGSHLMLSANAEARRMMRATGGWAMVREVSPASFAFHDLRDGSEYAVRLNRGRLPWWIFSARRRLPGTTAADHLRDLWRLARCGPEARVEETLAGPLYDRLWYPVAEAVMNTAPAEASARGFRAVVRDSLAKGEAACRPWLFPQGLGAALVTPTLRFLEAQGAEVRLAAPVKGLEVEGGRVVALGTRHGREPLGPGDSVVCALPAFAAGRLLPGLGPDEPLPTRAIVNAHFVVPGAVALPPPGFVGLIGGAAHWVFLRGDVLSVTVSAADAIAEQPDDAVLARLWADVRRLPALRHLGNRPPPGRVVRERRATLAHVPEIEAYRPHAETPLANLFRAGDWTATGYPCTVEGAIRSGVAAARAAHSAGLR